MPATLNPELQIELARWKERASSVEDDVGVFVSYDGPVSVLEDSALRLGHYDGTVATGRIRLADIEKFQETSGVLRINLAAHIALHIDRTMDEIGASAVRSKAPPYTSTSGARAYTGEGVLIGIIDDSLWEGHRSFTKPDPLHSKKQRTRIVGLWKQVVSDADTRPPPGFNYGRHWDEGQVNDLLGRGSTFTTSTGDHGTHVTGIAAANGWFPDVVVPYTLIGVAPEADIAFCNSANYDTTFAADAVKFIFDLAKKRRQPCVINMSFGTHEGARDGTSDLERVIKSSLFKADGAPEPGRAVVVAAGNEADMRRHSRKFMTANGTLIFRLDVGEFSYPNGVRVTEQKIPGDKILGCDRLYIWYRDSASLKVRIINPAGKAEPADWVDFDQIRFTDNVAIASGFPASANGKKYAVITLWAPIRNGRWTVEVEETAGSDTPIDVWVERINDGYIYPRFIDGDNVKDNTISCPATARGAITVGGYVSKPGSRDVIGQLFESSSRGLDSAYGVADADVRPHLVAPARMIISTNSSVYADEMKGLERMKARLGALPKFHALFSGTSQAAPHVTGVVALMLQKNRQLNALDIQRILTSTTSRKQISGHLPNRHWGYGCLDARAALIAVR